MLRRDSRGSGATPSGRLFEAAAVAIHGQDVNGWVNRSSSAPVRVCLPKVAQFRDKDMHKIRSLKRAERI